MPLLLYEQYKNLLDIVAKQAMRAIINVSQLTVCCFSTLCTSSNIKHQQQLSKIIFFEDCTRDKSTPNVMWRIYIHIAFVLFSLCWLASKDVTVHFRSDNGSAATRKYSRDLAVFGESKNLRTWLEEQKHRPSADECEALEVELECGPKVFEAAAQLIDAPLNSNVSEDVAFCSLILRRHWTFVTGRERMFYRDAQERHQAVTGSQTR